MRRSSGQLIVGKTYSRKALQKVFKINDSTINTGVFRPKGHGTVWLFVTETKTPDRTDYVDKLNGDDLVWEGQTSGRTDHLITNHVELGLELLLFYRESKGHYADYAFRFEGPFRYLDQHGTHPTRFHLRRNGAAE